MTNEIARISAWKRNFKTQTAIYSKISREILELPSDFELATANPLLFYTEGASRNLAKKVLHDALKKGGSFERRRGLVFVYIRANYKLK
jgi:hypothetical protein